LRESIKRHEYYLALRLGLNKTHKARARAPRARAAGWQRATAQRATAPPQRSS
jgi:hypothetical protein